MSLLIKSLTRIRKGNAHWHDTDCGPAGIYIRPSFIFAICKGMGGGESMTIHALGK